MPVAAAHLLKFPLPGKKKVFENQRFPLDNVGRYEVHEERNHSGLVKAGDYCFLSYCVGNIGGTIEE